MSKALTADQIEPGMVIQFLSMQATGIFLLYPTAHGISETYRSPVLAVNTYGKPDPQETQVVVVEGTFYFPDDALICEAGRITQGEVDFLIKARTERLAREYS